jgi:NAD(P)-dependent dehydrogenase (short-subunit alcohol dehydrogenase family)
MALRGSGAIVNVGSLNGHFGTDGLALYSATKAALHSLTKSWAAEYGPRGVRVNAVVPGATLTNKVKSMAEELQPLFDGLPSRRANSPEEVAEAVLFLVTPRSSNIHGALLHVDGGASALG